MTSERTIERVAEARIPTEFGEFVAYGYATTGGTEHVALVRGEVAGRTGVLVRVHSECLTGDVFGSLRCDCGSQLRAAMAAVARSKRGVVVYSRGQEGRGIGLLSKLRAYALQDEGLDTVEANEELGFEADTRDYADAAAVLSDLEIESVRLLSNNPAKRVGLERHGVVVESMVPLVTDPTSENRGYLKTKASKLGHLLDLD